MLQGTTAAKKKLEQLISKQTAKPAEIEKLGVLFVVMGTCIECIREGREGEGGNESREGGGSPSLIYSHGSRVDKKVIFVN